MSHPETGGGAGPAPTEEEMRAQLEAELKRLRVDDILLQTVVSLINLGARRAGLAGGDEAEQDLDQVQSAIDAVTALLPVLERGVGPSDLRPLRDALSQLQVAYAQRRGGAPAPAGQAPSGGDPAASPAAGAPGEEQPGSGPGPAQSSGRLWVPGQ